MAAATLFVALSGLSRTLGELAALRFMSGLCMAATIPLAMAWIADEVPAAVRQPVIGRYVNGLVLGQIAGGALGGIVAEYFEWRHIFYVFACATAVVAAALWTRAEHGVDRSAHARPLREVLAIYAGLFRARRSRRIIIVGTLEGVFIFGVLAYFGAWLRHAHGLDYARIGIVLGAYGLGGMISAAAVYRLVRLLGERRMVAWGALLLLVMVLNYYAEKRRNRVQRSES